MHTGIIIANTGSPSSPDPDDVEAYLQRFLMDPHICQLPRPLWHRLVFHTILPRRKYASAARYREIWRDDGAPLVVDQSRLASKLERVLASDPAALPSDGASDAGDVLVRSAMSYGDPFMGDVLDELERAGCDRVVLLPLYPMSAFSITQSVIDSFKAEMEQRDWHPRVGIVPNYYRNAEWVAAVADQIRQAGYDPQRDRLLLSYHSIPNKDTRHGDTYTQQCEEATRLIADALGIGRDEVTLGYACVFGNRPDKWAGPLSEDILRGWRDEFSAETSGARRVVVACPGFSIDGLETLYDIPHDYVPALLGDDAAHDDPRLVRVPCLNASDAHARALSSVLADALAGA